MFISFYITSVNNNLILQYLPTHDSPNFRQLVAKISSINNSDEETLSLGKNLTLHKYFSKVNNLRYLALFKGFDNPLLPIQFMCQFDQLLLSYFDKDTITATKLMNNYDRITLLLQSMIDSGEPIITDFNQLKSMVPLGHDLAKFINSTTKTIKDSIKYGTDSKNIFPDKSFNRLNYKQVVPWRSQNISYTNNEIYLDLFERVNVVYKLKKNRMAFVTGNISGQLVVKCYLSGMPTVQLSLQTVNNDLLVSLHKYINTQNLNFNFSRLNFIPPDGKSTLMEYSIDLSQSNRANALSNSGLITLSVIENLGVKNDEFEIRCIISNSIQVGVIENLLITLNHNYKIQNEKLKILRNTHGSFETNAENTHSKWIFDKETVVGSLPILRGCIENINVGSTITSITGFLKCLDISYSYKGQLASGMKVGLVTILNGLPSGTKPFKGVRYVTTVENFTVRMH